MNNIILLVFEGEKTELAIYKNLKSIFFSSSPNTFIFATYKTDIYQLWKQMSNDSDLDIVEVIREKYPDQLKGISRKAVSQVYLFFDHDAHAKKSLSDSFEEIKGMIKLFDNETEAGKLFISYPMVEALNDLVEDENICNECCTNKIAENTKYKKKVAERSNHTDIKKFNRETWKSITNLNLKKANCIINDIFKTPAIKQIELFTQENIYQNQEVKFLIPYKSVAILSSFPFFLLEYFGFDLFK